jgi:outer membrane lipoprotein SlyB
MGASAALALLFAASVAVAQAPQIVHGTLDKVDGPTLVIKKGDGSELTVKLLDNAKIFGVKSATIADVKPNDFIGVGATPQPDGSQKAIQVTIFAESQRGSNPGFRPWDKPGTTMTNGTADSIVASVDGQVVMVKYDGGQQKIVIGPDAQIRMYVPGTADQLKPGARVAVFNPQTASDGSTQTGRVNVGIGDMAP